MLFLEGFEHSSTTTARLNILGGLEQGGLDALPLRGYEMGETGLPNALAIAERVLERSRG